MKKYLLFTVLAVVGLGFSHHTNAQCTPDPQYTEIGVWPEALPASCLNTEYDESLTLIYPNDTCVTIFGPQCTVFELESATISNIAGLPSGITYTCPTNDCVYLPGTGETTTSCIQISGTPTQSGTFTATVFVALNSNGISYNVDYDFEITVNEAGSDDCLAVGFLDNINSIGLTVSPNPTSGTVLLNKVSTGIIKNAQGTTVLNVNNTDSFDINSLSNGLYFLSTEEETVKIIKE